jgi:tetratricopeptide (TPR) repeat protein
MAEALPPVEIFCCYSHEDEMWLRKLETHLSELVRQGFISLWYDRLISPGTAWAEVIDQHLETASVVLLLVSADFLASDYCTGREMKRAMARQEAGEARVIPLLVREVYWKDAPFAHLQVLPTDARPLSIWRDEDTALADVVAGIRRVLEDLPLPAASTPRTAMPAIWNIPYPRNPFFLGRDEELSQVRYHLQGDPATAHAPPQAISGLGGVGKTQLALEYAYRYHQDYQVVLWAHAESIEALVSSYVAIATLLLLPERKAMKQDIMVQAVKIWLQTHRSWLLILDNADELTLLPDFLPSTLGGHLLLTTRATATGRLAFRLEVETLRPEHAALFLLRRAALLAPNATLEQASAEERELALQISQELGRLPLALDQAGAYLEETGADLDSYWQIYQQHRANLLERRGGLVADHPAPVATTWSLSFERVEEKNPATADLLRLCAFLAPDSIPEEILAKGTSCLGPGLAEVTADVFRLNQAIEALRAYSLVRRNPKEKTLSIHRLVQAVLQDTLSEQERRLWAEQTILAVNTVFSEPLSGGLPSRERLLPHVLLAAQWSDIYQINRVEVGHLFLQAGKFFRYAQAESLCRRGLVIYKQWFGSEHSKVAEALTILGNILRGPSAEAEQLYRQALAIYEKQMQPEHSYGTLFPMTNLAQLYIEQKKYILAESLCQQALTIAEQQFGSEDPRLCHRLNDLADCYCKQGKYTLAEPLYQRALAIDEGVALQPEQWFGHRPNERILRILSLDVANALNRLAHLYSKQGKYAEAELLYQRALPIYEQQSESERWLVYPPNHLPSPLNALANLSLEQGKYAEAERLYQRALSICERLQTFKHLATVEVMHGLARLGEAQGNNEEARIWYARALAIREQTLGVHHSKTMETRKRLIALLHATGVHEEAAQLEEFQSEL